MLTLTTKEKRMKNTNDQKRSKGQEQHKQQPENRLFHVFLTLPPTDRQLKHTVCKAVRVSVCQKVFVRITFSHTTLLPKQNLQSGFSEVTLYPLFICVKCVIKTKSAAVMATNLTSQFYQDKWPERTRVQERLSKTGHFFISSQFLLTTLDLSKKRKRKCKTNIEH